MDWERFFTLLLVLVFSLTAHEAAHGLTAWLGGDRTAKDRGLVTLNPIPHMKREPMGMVVVPVIVIFLSNGTLAAGGASAPIDANWAETNPKKAALMSAAGPLANIALAAIAFGVLHYIGRPNVNDTTAIFVGQTAWLVVLLNLLLATFNLMPLPPFDGAGVVCGLLPAARRAYGLYQRIPLAFILSMVGAYFLVSSVLPPLASTVRNWLTWPYWGL